MRKVPQPELMLTCWFIQIRSLSLFLTVLR